MLIIVNPSKDIWHCVLGPVQHEIVMYILPKEEMRRMVSAACNHFVLTNTLHHGFALGPRSRDFLYFKRMKNYHHSIQNHYRLQRLGHEIFRKFILEFNILKACFKTIIVISGSVPWANSCLKNSVSWLIPSVVSTKYDSHQPQKSTKACHGLLEIVSSPLRIVTCHSWSCSTYFPFFKINILFGQLRCIHVGPS